MFGVDIGARGRGGGEGALPVCLGGFDRRVLVLAACFDKDRATRGEESARPGVGRVLLRYLCARFSTDASIVVRGPREKKREPKPTGKHVRRGSVEGE